MCWKPEGTVQDKIDKLNGFVTPKELLDIIDGPRPSYSNSAYCTYDMLTHKDDTYTSSDLTIDFDTISTIKIKCEGNTYTLDKNQLIYFILQLFEEKK